MLTQDDLDADLDAAVAQGIITDAQATALRALAAKRANRAAARRDEERFRFMRGFNDFFFASGVLLFGLGTSFFAGQRPVGSIIAGATIWALAELLVARMRQVLPGIVAIVVGLALGAMVLIVGVAWLPLRRGLMGLVPSRLALRLPSVVSAA